MLLRLSAVLLWAAAMGAPADAAEGTSPSARYHTDNDWGAGIVGEFSLSNPGGPDVAAWTLSFDFPANISNLWGGRIAAQQGSHYEIQPETWSSHIAPGNAITVGFQAAPGGSVPQNIQLATVLAAAQPTPSSAGQQPPPPAPAPSGAPSPSSTPVPLPAATPIPTPAAASPTSRIVPAPSAPAMESGHARLWFQIKEDWGTGLRAEVIVQNRDWRTLRDWTLYLEYPGRVAQVTGARWTASAGESHRFDAPLNGPNVEIPPLGSIRFSIVFRPGGVAGLPHKMVFRAVESPGFSGHFNYSEALQMALYFYEAQRSGKLPTTNRVPWRGDSALHDGRDDGVDLSGGYYDAGDHLKFTFPLSASLTLLAWGGLEYHAGYERAGQWAQFLATVRWGTDWLLKAHPAPNVLYAQVGNGTLDHAYWGSPEGLNMTRPAYRIDVAHPGSDLAGEASAALASASLLFKNEDPAYSKLLLKHARQLFAFADQDRGIYSEAVPQAKAFYPSSGYQDELAWAAAWLYSATGETGYLAKAENLYDRQLKNTVENSAPNWDDKRAALAVLLSCLTKQQTYRTDAEAFLDYWTMGREGRRIHYTPGGLAWFGAWGSLRYAATTSFLALVYSDSVADYQNVYLRFGCQQINYILGDNPGRRSFVVGFGPNPVRNPHHRGAHGSTTGSIDDPVDNRHILYGALVGGPAQPDDTFVDNRRDSRTNEVALDYNAGFTGALARMVMLSGGQPLKNFPP